MALMKSLQLLCRSLFWLVTGGLIAFCLAFGLPFLSKIAAGKVIAMAGCTPPSFDMQAVCPAGSYAEKFVPLSHWFNADLGLAANNTRPVDVACAGNRAPKCRP